MHPPYDSRQIANYLIRLSNKQNNRMSIMRVLKLAYMAHGWSLAIIDKPLINEYVQAWRYGPVIPSIYYSFRPQGIYDLKPTQFIHESEIDDDTKELIPAVYDLYSHLGDGRFDKSDSYQRGTLADDICSKQN